MAKPSSIAQFVVLLALMEEHHVPAQMVSADTSIRENSPHIDPDRLYTSSEKTKKPLSRELSSVPSSPSHPLAPGSRDNSDGNWTLSATDEPALPSPTQATAVPSAMNTAPLATLPYVPSRPSDELGGSGISVEPRMPEELVVESSLRTSLPREAAAPAFVLPPRSARRLHDQRPVEPKDRVSPFHSVAVGVGVSTLGAGAELAIPIASKLNLRAGAAYFSWAPTLSADGISFAPLLRFSSARATLDWFPRKNVFHVSAGALLLHTHLAALAEVAPGQSFSLGSTTYINSVDDPVSGYTKINYGSQFAPLVLVGVGNLLPRNGQHISMPFEVGAAYMRAPQLSVQLAGTACNGQGCFNAATSPEVQADLMTETGNLQSDLRVLTILPIVSLGLACRF